MKLSKNQENVSGGFRGWGISGRFRGWGAPPPPIHNAPLTYAYPNTIGTCLTPYHLLFCRKLFSTSTVVRNLTVLSSTTDKINRISCSAQCWSFMQCCARNFLTHSWHKPCNVDAVIKTVNLTNVDVVKLNRF